MIVVPPYWYHFAESDPKRWEACRKQAREEILARGFDPMSKKLDDAIRKRARVLWNIKKPRP